MTVYGVTDGRGGVWAFDPDVIYGIVRASVRARMIRRRSRVVTENHGILMPDTYHVETNWTGFRQAYAAEADLYWAEAEMQLRTDPRNFFGTLVGLTNDAIVDTNWHRQQVASCSQRSSRNIERVVGNWETALTTARVVRDASATILVVTAGVVMAPAGAAAAGAAGMTGISAGTATTTLAVGSAMRGAFTYQDTGNVGSAMVNATGTFVVGMIGISGASAATLTSGQQATVLIIGSAAQGTTAGTQALIEGKSMQQAAVAAAIGAGSQALGGVIGSRIESLGFFTQVAAGTIIDLGGNMASAAVVDRMGAAPAGAPRVGGNIDFLGLPAAQSEDYVRRYALRQIR